LGDLSRLSGIFATVVLDGPKSVCARPMQRTISRLIETPLAELILQGGASSGASLRVRARAGKILIENC